MKTTDPLLAATFGFATLDHLTAWEADELPNCPRLALETIGGTALVGPPLLLLALGEERHELSAELALELASQLMRHARTMMERERDEAAKLARERE